MEKKIIATKQAPSAIGPYAQAVQIGNLLYTSGQIPLDPATGEVVAGDVQAQTKQVLENLSAVLQAANMDLSHVVKTLVFIQDMNDFTAINEIYSQFFTENPPARSCVEVARLPKDVKVEIECIAIRA